MTPENVVQRMWWVREAFFAISECSVPVIGAVDGVVLGPGPVFAAFCDFTVAAEDAQFGLPGVGPWHQGLSAPFDPDCTGAAGQADVFHGRAIARDRPRKGELAANFSHAVFFELAVVA